MSSGITSKRTWLDAVHAVSKCSADTAQLLSEMIQSRSHEMPVGHPKDLKGKYRVRCPCFINTLLNVGPTATEDYCRPTTQWNRKPSPLKVSLKREFSRFWLETFGIFSS